VPGVGRLVYGVAADRRKNNQTKKPAAAVAGRAEAGCEPILLREAVNALAVLGPCGLNLEPHLLVGRPALQMGVGA
jgi:hypothetical protein